MVTGRGSGCASGDRPGAGWVVHCCSGSGVWLLGQDDPATGWIGRVAAGGEPGTGGGWSLGDPIADQDITLLDGVLVANRPRTVFDLLRTASPAASRELLDTALQRRWLTLGELTARVRAHAGRRDAPTLVALVRHAASGARSRPSRDPGAVPARSGPAEPTGRRRLDSAALHLARPHQPAGSGGAGDRHDRDPPHRDALSRLFAGRRPVRWGAGWRRPVRFRWCAGRWPVRFRWCAGWRRRRVR